jgi:NAD(P)-dependent dehydrogenase (short-subunit alcohol dehydrogenase family)
MSKDKTHSTIAPGTQGGGCAKYNREVFMRNRLRALIGVAALLTCFAFLSRVDEAQSSATKHQQAVLVTGASTGIGRKITERLAADGYFVYAGARKEADLKALGALPNVQPVRLDVTNLQDIDAAVATIAKGGRGLYGLVNNAGVVTVAPVIDMKMEEFDVVMAVNVFGPWRITRAFAPLIIASRGRIANVGSINGIYTSPQSSAYSMSKHAIEAFTDGLAQEMNPLGVKVAIIEPGGYKSDIFKNEIQRSGTGAGLAEMASREKDPDEVAAATEQALFEPNPKRRYMVVPNQDQAQMTIKAQIEQLVQLNEGQRYTYDRQTLVKMLDDALAKARPRTQ